MLGHTEHPEIRVSYAKFYNNVFNQTYYTNKITHTAGEFFPYDNTIILSYGYFTKELMIKTARTLEEAICCTITHEITHWILFKEQNIKVCEQFDNIAKSLTEYGLW